jgi:hypothetical protein
LVSLTGSGAREGGELLGGGGRDKPGDAIATKVLVKGEPIPAPAGRADDFAWPRRGLAPVGEDPVAAKTNLPMTPMLAEKPPATASPAAEPQPGPGAQPAARTAAARNGRQPPGQGQQAQSRTEQRRQMPFSFFPFLFGR